MGGRKPKPASVQIAEGDPSKRGPGKLRERLAAEPKASGGLGECPKYLTGPARRAWKLWSEELAVMNLDKKPDGPALEAACLAYQRMIKAHRKGFDSAANQSASVVKAFCSEFGFTPASRTRLALNKPPDKPENDLLKALSAPREPRPAFVQ